MKVFAELKNGSMKRLSASLGTGKRNPYHPPTREIQWAWTNPALIAKAALELRVKPKSIRVIIETL